MGWHAQCSFNSELRGAATVGALAPGLARLLEGYPEIQHVKVEDGPGLPLGRSFRVKLWPTLVFLRHGKVAKQVARPGVREVREGLEMSAGEGRDHRRPSVFRPRNRHRTG